MVYFCWILLNTFLMWLLENIVSYMWLTSYISGTVLMWKKKDVFLNLGDQRKLKRRKTGEGCCLRCLQYGKRTPLLGTLFCFGEIDPSKWADRLYSGFTIVSFIIGTWNWANRMVNDWIKVDRVLRAAMLGNTRVCMFNCM